MQPKKPFYRGPSNVVYQIDGASYGLDDSLVEAIRNSIHARLKSGSLEVPRLPQVASRILQLTSNSETDVVELERAIAIDPLLATRILTVANSAAYGGGPPLRGLGPALMRMGLKTVCDLVFAESVRLRVFSSRSYRSILEQSWRLSLGTAIASEALSIATGVERDGAFLLGLLHDIGKPVLINAISEYEKQNKGLSLGQDTVEILMSQLHEEIGAYVLERWEMPPAFVGAAGSHHRYRGGANATPAHRLIYAANLVCQHLGIGDIQKDVDFVIEHVFADLKLTDFDRISPLLDGVAQEFESMIVGLADAA